MSRVILALIIILWALQSYCRAQQNDRFQPLAMSTYEVVFDNALGIPIYAQWFVDRSDIGKIKREPSMTFHADPRTALPQVLSSHYNHSGFHRGHMVPAADRSRSLAAMQETFIMSNVCPQLPSLNTGAWKRLENYERTQALKIGRVCVRVAPIFIHEDTLLIGNGRVAVPHGFIKVIYAAGSDSVLACEIFSNQNAGKKNTERNTQ